MGRLRQDIHGPCPPRVERHGAGAGSAVRDPAPRHEKERVAGSGELVGRCLSADSAAFVDLVRQESGE